MTNLRVILLRALRKLKLIGYLNLSLRLKRNNLNINIPIIGGLGIEHFLSSEMWMQTLAQKLIRIKKGKFVDVGANIGQTLIAIKSIDPKVDYIGFEPNPTCVFYLSRLIPSSWKNNTQIIPSGIFSTEGVLPIYLNSELPQDSCASLIKDFREFGVDKSTMVPVITHHTLDKLFEGAISIIKIDVEGSELEVLQELSNQIIQHRPFIICEILPAYSGKEKARSKRQEKIGAFIKGLDYLIYSVGDSLEQLNEIPDHDDISKSNYLFVPKEIEELDPAL